MPKNRRKTRNSRQETSNAFMIAQTAVSWYVWENKEEAQQYRITGERAELQLIAKIAKNLEDHKDPLEGTKLYHSQSLIQHLENAGAFKQDSHTLEESENETAKTPTPPCSPIKKVIYHSSSENTGPGQEEPFPHKKSKTDLHEIDSWLTSSMQEPISCEDFFDFLEGGELEATPNAETDIFFDALPEHEKEKIKQETLTVEEILASSSAYLS